MGQGNDAYEILIPLDKKLGDYWERLIEAVQVLSIAEQRNREYVVADIANAGTDITRIRSDSEQSHLGQIPLDDAVVMVQNARELFLSAARSIVSDQPKAEFRSRPPERVARFTEDLRMGQTERGSYVITVISKLTPDPRPQVAPELKEPPFERQVLHTLNTALHEVRAIANRERKLSDERQIYDLVQKGVSVNLCQAVLNLQKAARGGVVEIGFNLSRTIAAPGSLRDSIAFESKQAPILEDALQALRSSIYDEDRRLSGTVVGLERQEGEETGKVTIVTVIEDRA